LVTEFLDSGLSALSSRPKGFHRSDDFLRNHQKYAIERIKRIFFLKNELFIFTMAQICHNVMAGDKP